MKILTIIIGTLFMFSCGNTSNVENKLPQNVKFESDTIIFKQIPIGSNITKTIRFENTSHLPVKIINVGAECGCTTSTYDKHIIKPAAFGEVKVTYSNTEDTMTVLKSVIIELNTQNPYHIVYLKAEI